MTPAVNASDRQDTCRPQSGSTSGSSCGPDAELCQKIAVVVLAHNEERRIGACLASLPLGLAGVSVHVVVNGSRDRTADVARAAGEAGKGSVTVHDWAEGGKARSWNRIMLDTPGVEGDCYVFVDGDAEVIPGSIQALARLLTDHPQANCAAGLPCNGRRAPEYRRQMMATHGMFGDLYALDGGFVARLRNSGIRLPEDLIGDDSLIGALAKTGLASEDEWDEDRLLPCIEAGFLCEPTRLLSAASTINQYRRMTSYSIRHFQNAIVSAIMRDSGPAGLPRSMAELYEEWLPRFVPRRHSLWWWFDVRALARMRANCAALPGSP